MGIQRNVDAGSILLTQEAYARAVLDKSGMADARPAKTPAEAGPICIEEEEVLSPEETTYFRSATGSVLYLSRCTRPDITRSVMVPTRSMSKPGPKAMSKLKGVLRCAGYLLDHSGDEGCREETPVCHDCLVVNGTNKS
ncbi:unnamed protein product [Ascophyllum nodosum]